MDNLRIVLIWGVVAHLIGVSRGGGFYQYRGHFLTGKTRVNCDHCVMVNFRIHWERIRGVAAAFGVDPRDDGFDLSAIAYNIGLPLFSAGCSVVSVPPSLTTTSHGYLSRNFDFPPVSMADFLHFPLSPAEKTRQRPVFSEPYIMEWYPQDGGYPRNA